MRHQEAHPGAGKAVRIASGPYKDFTLDIEDWWDRIAGKSWMDCVDDPTCHAYAEERAMAKAPMDDEVVYGKIGLSGGLFHASWLEAAA